MILRDKGYIIGSGNEFFGEEYNKIIQSSFDVNHKDMTFKTYYSLGEVSNVKMTDAVDYQSMNNVKNGLLSLLDFEIVQMWFLMAHYGNIKLGEYIKPTLAPLFESDFETPSFDITLYNKDCFIENHRDGVPSGRLFVMISYLNKDWEQGMGGELVIKDINDNEIVIEPKFGNFALFNFAEENLEHRVNKVLSDTFERKSLITIVDKKI